MKYKEIEDMFKKSKTDIKYKKEQHYVYALWDKDEIVYIGQTTNLYMRIGQHLTNKKFDSYSFIEVFDEYIAEDLESYAIYSANPKYNKTSEPKFIAVTKLRQKLINEVAEIQDMEELYTNNLTEILKNNDIDIHYKGKKAHIKIHDLAKAMNIGLKYADAILRR